MKITMVHRLIAAAFLLATWNGALAVSPDCTDADARPAGMAFAHLKNAALVDNDNLDFSKTAVVRLASEEIGKNLYRQIHRVTFVKRSGEHVVAITVNEASNPDCSASAVDVYVVAKRLGDYSKPD